jgi:hypothetical protein
MEMVDIGKTISLKFLQNAECTFHVTSCRREV